MGGRAHSHGNSRCVRSTNPTVPITSWSLSEPWRAGGLDPSRNGNPWITPPLPRPTNWSAAWGQGRPCPHLLPPRNFTETTRTTSTCQDGKKFCTPSRATRRRKMTDSARGRLLLLTGNEDGWPPQFLTRTTEAGPGNRGSSSSRGNGYGAGSRRGLPPMPADPGTQPTSPPSQGQAHRPDVLGTASWHHFTQELISSVLKTQAWNTTPQRLAMALGASAPQGQIQG